MATYWRGFADGIADWTQVELTSGHTDPAWSVVNTDQLQATSASSHNEALIWDDLDADGDRDDFEILGQIYVDSSTTTQRWFGGRISTSGSSRNGYALRVRTNSIDLYRFSGSTYTSVSGVTISIPSGTWCWVRWRINGSLAYARIWENGDSEPGTWNLDGLDASFYSTVGHIGCIKGANTNTQLWRYFGVGTNGDTAPASAGSASESALAATGGSGTLSASASSPAVSALAATGGSGTLSATASSPATATLGATGGSGSLSASAGAGASAELAATGGSGALSAVASAPASSSLAATGGSGALSASAYPLVQASLAATGGAGSLAASAGSIVEASLAITGGSGTLAASATVPATASLSATGGSGQLAAHVDFGEAPVVDEPAGGDGENYGPIGRGSIVHRITARRGLVAMPVRPVIGEPLQPPATLAPIVVPAAFAARALRAMPTNPRGLLLRRTAEAEPRVYPVRFCSHCGAPVAH